MKNIRLSEVLGEIPSARADQKSWQATRGITRTSKMFILNRNSSSSVGYANQSRFWGKISPFLVFWVPSLSLSSISLITLSIRDICSSDIRRSRSGDRLDVSFVSWFYRFSAKESVGVGVFCFLLTSVEVECSTFVSYTFLYKISVQLFFCLIIL